MDLQALFGEEAVETILRFVESTAMGKRREAHDMQGVEEWDIGLLDKR